MKDRNTRTIQVGHTTVVVDIDEKPRPNLIVRALGIFGIALLVGAPVAGWIILAVAGTFWVFHRTVEKGRIEAMAQESAVKAAAKHRDSQILAYKSLG